MTMQLILLMTIFAFLAFESLAANAFGQSGGKDASQGNSGMKLIRNTVDPNGLPCHKIVTPTAVYFLDVKGAGISHMFDREGKDWISHNPEKGTGAGGEYRGFPNAVHQRGALGAFHPMNSGTMPSTTTIVREEADRIDIQADSQDGLWQCRYEFRPDCLTWTMLKMPQGRQYWCLYEGTPGGSYDDTDYWMTSAIAEKTPLTSPHEGDIPAPEWICFGDASLDRVLFLAHHEDDSFPDTYYQMKKQMTVFGFGRKGLESFLATVPQSVTIGFIESTDHPTISKEIGKILGSAF